MKKKSTFTSNFSARDLPGWNSRGSLGRSGLILVTELEFLALLANKCFG